MGPGFYGQHPGLNQPNYSPNAIAAMNGYRAVSSSFGATHPYSANYNPFVAAGAPSDAMARLQGQYSFAQLQGSYGSDFGQFIFSPFRANPVSGDNMRQAEFNAAMRQLAERSGYRLRSQLTATNFGRQTLGRLVGRGLYDDVFGGLDRRHRAVSQGALRLANVVGRDVGALGSQRIGGGAYSDMRISDDISRALASRAFIEGGNRVQYGRMSQEEMTQVYAEMSNRGLNLTAEAGLDLANRREDRARYAARARRRVESMEGAMGVMQETFGTTNKGELMTLVQDFMGMTRDVDEFSPMEVDQAARQFQALAQAAGKSKDAMMNLIKEGRQMARGLGVETMGGGQIMARSAADIRQGIARGTVGAAELGAVGGVEGFTRLKSSTLMGLANDRLTKELQMARFASRGQFMGRRGIGDDDIGGIYARMTEEAERGSTPYLDPGELSRSLDRRARELLDPQARERAKAEATTSMLMQQQQATEADVKRQGGTFGLVGLTENIYDATGKLFERIAPGIASPMLGITNALGITDVRMEGEILGYSQAEKLRRAQAEERNMLDRSNMMGSRATIQAIIEGRNEIGGSRALMQTWFETYGKTMAEQDPDSLYDATTTTFKRLMARAEGVSGGNELLARRRLQQMLEAKGINLNAAQVRALMVDAKNNKQTEADLGRTIAQMNETELLADARRNTYLSQDKADELYTNLLIESGGDVSMATDKFRRIAEGMRKSREVQEEEDAQQQSELSQKELDQADERDKQARLNQLREGLEQDIDERTRMDYNRSSREAVNNVLRQRSRRAETRTQSRTDAPVALEEDETVTEKKQDVEAAAEPKPAPVEEDWRAKLNWRSESSFGSSGFLSEMEDESFNFMREEKTEQPEQPQNEFMGRAKRRAEHMQRQQNDSTMLAISMPFGKKSTQTYNEETGASKGGMGSARGVDYYLKMILEELRRGNKNGQPQASRVDSNSTDRTYNKGGATVEYI